MKEIMHKLQWTCLQNVFELEEAGQKLLALAKKSLKHSHSPYSNFKVGAAVLLENGKMLGGSNQENAAYPMCLCAERVALAAAASQQPGKTIMAMAITVKHPTKIINQPVMPCGSCRQAICEMEQKQQRPIQLIIRGEEGNIFIFKTGLDILPFAFDGALL